MTEDTEAPETAHDEGAEESDGLMRAETLYQEIARRLMAEIEYFEHVPFGELPAVERNRIRLRVKGLAQTIIFEAIRIVHDEGAPSIDAVIKGITLKKDGVGISLMAPHGQENRNRFNDSLGREVCLVLTDVAKYFEGGDEMSLGAENETDLAADDLQADKQKKAGKRKAAKKDEPAPVKVDQVAVFKGARGTDRATSEEGKGDRPTDREGDQSTTCAPSGAGGAASQGDANSAEGLQGTSS